MLNGELKYVCWKKFSEGEWRSTQELAKVHLMIRWLNSLKDLPTSLMCLSFPEWQALYRTYLIGVGMYKRATTNGMNENQQPSITLRDRGYISLLRQASIMLAQAYDLKTTHCGEIGGEYFAMSCLQLLNQELYVEGDDFFGLLRS